MGIQRVDICLLSNHCDCIDDTYIWWKRGWWLIWTSDIWAASNIWALPAALCLRPLLCDYQRDISLQLQHRHDHHHHHHKGRVALTKRNYFRKTSEGGWVIFNQNIYVADFGPLNRAFWAWNWKNCNMIFWKWGKGGRGSKAIKLYWDHSGLWRPGW